MSNAEAVPGELSGPCQICEARTFTKLFQKNGFDILKCSSCGIVFTNIPPGFDLLSIYDESYFQGGQADGYLDHRER